MGVYSTNQNRQFYVANSVATSVSENSAVGTVQVKCISDGADKELYFLIKGAEDVLKSDRIQLRNLNYIKAIPAQKMVTPLKKYLLKLDTAVNAGKPVIGQDYLLRIVFRQFFGMSDEDVYFKDCAVHATSAMNANPTLFYNAMVDALNLSFSREIGANKASNPYLKFEASSNGVIITEKPQEWTLGIQSQESVMFDVIPTTVYADGQDVVWGTVENQTPSIANAVVGTTGIGNGHNIADMEYFYMGERGDQYRMVGYPNYVPTKYLVDPSKEYDVLELHFGFTDTGVNSYRSEKDITIVAPKSTTAIKDLVTAINTATGLSVENPFVVSAGD